MAGVLVAKKYGPKNTILVFFDTKTKDEDLYRFLYEGAEHIGAELLRLEDGRDIWEVFSDTKIMGNSRIDPCSRILKREPFKKYMEKWHSPESDTLHVGINWDEQHRLERMRRHWAPWKVEAPLCWEPLTTHADMLNYLKEHKIELPRLYKMGFPHNNCGGFCIKTGQAQMKLLLEKMPERYAYHEQKQEALFKELGKKHGFIRQTINGELKYLTLKQFREQIEANPDMQMGFDFGGCGCFVEEDEDD